MDLKPLEILLVEDNPGDVRLVFEELEDYKVLNHLTVVGDADEAIDYLTEMGLDECTPRPDIVFLDLTLPGKSGFAVLEVMKKRAHLREIPVVVLTGSKGQEDVVESFDLKASCYVNKPLDLTKFINIMHSVDDLWLAITRMPA